MSTSNTELQSWVEEVSEMTKPDNIYWCNGAKEEYEELCGDERSKESIHFVVLLQMWCSKSYSSAVYVAESGEQSDTVDVDKLHR